MPTINVTPTMLEYLKTKGITDKELILITDDAGGKYSLNGGSCSLGANFTIIVLDQPDPDYQLKMENNADLHMWTSKYDTMFFESGLTLDYKNHSVEIRDNAHILDNAVQIANGQEVLNAAGKGMQASGGNC
ncbi:iron-sulfur cluster biosynthesis family protein [Lentilactobacillus senioris]|nr:iron-sulfur cluster biosynthesis family protein [Lentilactobacillus senioris]MCY9806041.1 iron-sulfur cluster biosynthesis family protein [Lentilactobacillus senioris]